MEMEMETAMETKIKLYKINVSTTQYSYDR